jgi:hypothetical protein
MLTKQRITEIFDRYYAGESIGRILESPKDRHEFFDLLAQNAELSERYSRAQAARAELYGDQVVEIADNEPDFQRARNKMDARKYVASKLHPQKWGDRIDLNIKTIDLSIPLAEAEGRLQLRPGRDLEKQVISQVVNLVADKRDDATDSTSDVPPEEDLFAD